MKRLARAVLAIVINEVLAVAERYVSGEPKNEAEEFIFGLVDKAKNDIFSVFNRIKERVYA